MVKHPSRCLLFTFAIALAFAGSLPAVTLADETPINSWLADEMDWPYWRGPEMNGVSREKGLIDRWSKDGENLIFREPALAGFSSPICMRGKLYMTARNLPETEREGEKVICADA